MQNKLTVFFIGSILGCQTLPASDNKLANTLIAAASAFSLVSAGVYTYQYINKQPDTLAAEETTAIGELVFAQIDHHYTENPDSIPVVGAPWGLINSTQKKCFVLAELAEGTRQTVPLEQRTAATKKALEAANQFDGLNLLKRQLRAKLHNELEEHAMERSVGPGSSSLFLPGLERPQE
jgi:hypothetical protein